VLAQLTSGKLETRPIDVCVLGLLPAVVLSHLTHVYFGGAWTSTVYFLKVLIYYFLFTSLVTTPRRLRTFIACMVVFSAAVVVLATMDYYSLIELPRIVEQFRDQEGVVRRLYGPGIFQDPNDICALIVTSLLLVLGLLSDRRSGTLRWAYLAPLAVFVWGFYLTQSRGGLLALMAGLGLFVALRYGWRRAILLGLLGLPVLGLLGARQTAISADTNTGQERIQLWSDAMVMFRSNPLFGVGENRFTEFSTHVAHNSYLQYFAELGLFGGVLFLGAAYLSISGLVRLGRPVGLGRHRVVPAILDADLNRLFPFLAGAVAAWCTGMMTLTLNNLVITYAVFGMASTFLALAVTRPATPAQRFDFPLMMRLTGISLLFLAVMFVFIRLTFRA
jgi:O-antigen ligase